MRQNQTATRRAAYLLAGVLHAADGYRLHVAVAKRVNTMEKAKATV
jgi:hypothetical protein